MHEKTRNALTSLMQKIQLGDYSNGEKLPSERKLSEIYQVGRGALRAIFNELQKQHLIGRNSTGKVIVQLSPPPVRQKLLAINYDLMGFPNKIKAIKIYQAMLKRANELNYEIDHYFSPYSNLTNEQYRSILNGKYQGVLFNEMIHYPTVKNLLAHQIPCVVAKCESTLDFPQVRQDWEKIGASAGAELLRYGHREIGVISGDLSQAIFQELLSGFKSALKKNGIKLPSHRIVCIDAWSQDEPKYLEQIRPLLFGKPPVSAFFVTRDRRAAFLLRACLLWNLEFPKNFSVIGFDNSWCGSEIYNLTTFSEDDSLIGAEAVNLLHQWIIKKAPPESLILPFEFIERKSIIPLSTTQAPAPDSSFF